MANIDLTPEPGGNGTNPADENRAAKPADPRVKELEQEVARLRGQLGELQRKYEIEHELLNARIVAELPKNEEEFLKLAREGPLFKDLIAELVKEFGLEEKL
jgi:hypothetical protein